MFQQRTSLAEYRGLPVWGEKVGLVVRTLSPGVKSWPESSEINEEALTITRAISSVILNAIESQCQDMGINKNTCLEVMIHVSLTP